MRKTNYPKNRTSLLYSFLSFGMLGITILSACEKIDKKSMNTKSSTSIKMKHSQTYQELGFFGKIKEDRWDTLVEAVRANVTNSRQEPGNIAFHLFASENSNHEAFWFERFETKKAHNFHKQQAYFKNAINVIQASVETESTSIYLKEILELSPKKALESNIQQPTTYVFMLFEVNPNHRKDFIEKMKQITPLARQAQGNLEFNLYEYAEEDNKFVLMEGWQTKEAYQMYLKSEHSKELKRTLNTIIVNELMNQQWIVQDISTYR